VPGANHHELRWPVGAVCFCTSPRLKRVQVAFSAELKLLRIAPSNTAGEQAHSEPGGSTAFTSRP
jgi:hypothetical protein